MVREVVDDGHAARDAAHLLAAPHAQEAAHGRGDRGQLDAQAGRDRDHADQVLVVVDAGQVRLDGDDALAPPRHVQRRRARRARAPPTSNVQSAPEPGRP